VTTETRLEFRAAISQFYVAVAAQFYQQEVVAEMTKLE
jgi:hypothetical protein